MTRHRGQRQTLSAYAPEPGSPRAPGPLPTSGTPPAARHAGGDLGHPQRLVAAAQVWSFAGFDPVTQQSGDFRRVSHISRKDDPGLRDTLFLIGLHTARTIPAIARIKQRAKARGMGDVVAMLHAAHKANRICHHLALPPAALRPAPRALRRVCHSKHPPGPAADRST